MSANLPPRQLAAEAAGAALLSMAVTGSGIMAERLSNGNIALALLGCSLGTAAMLAGLLLMLAPAAPACFNPAVALMLVLRGEMKLAHGGAFAAVQTAGALTAVVFTHVMMGMAWVQDATQIRSGLGPAMGEAVAAVVLMLAVMVSRAKGPAYLAAVLALVTMANFWGTNSTALANPALTAARTITDTFASIRPADAAVFIAVELAVAVAIAFAAGRLIAPAKADDDNPHT
jgi:glycerol uptake facilitator-like aquaporin